MHNKNKFSFFDHKEFARNANQMQMQKEPQDREMAVGGNQPRAEEVELDYDQLASKRKLFNKTGDLTQMRKETQKLKNEEVEDLCEEPRASSPCKSTNDVFEPRGRDSDTSSQIARNLRGLEAAEHLRTNVSKFGKTGDDGDEPALRSPDLRLRESRVDDRQEMLRAQSPAAKV